MTITASLTSSSTATWVGGVHPAGNLLRERFRVPDPWVRYICNSETTEQPGYFTFGEGTVCFGSCSDLSVSRSPKGSLEDALSYTSVGDRFVEMPFDLGEVAGNLLFERYAEASAGNGIGKSIRSAYYSVRPLLGVHFRKYLQRFYLKKWKEIPFPQWPIDRTVDRLLERSLALGIQASGATHVPFIWFWPREYQSACIVTHDVEQRAGRDDCGTLMDLEDAVGIKSSFQVVPELRYEVPEAFLASIRDRGFEVCVHDLNHDGLLFSDEKIFQERAAAINRYARQWGAAGFRSGAMYRNPDWLSTLDFEYDMSMPNAAHLEPQRGGCCTLMPYFIGSLVELPLTTSQDYSVFHILNQRTLHLWEEEIETIHRHHGLITVLTHPDYLLEPWSRELYRGLLQHIAEKAARERIWLARPREVSQWWRTRSKLALEREGDGWKIVGEGSERAQIAYACLEGDELTYSLNPSVATASTLPHE